VAVELSYSILGDEVDWGIRGRWAVFESRDLPSWIYYLNLSYAYFSLFNEQRME
jgi:hypothetical protein